MVTLNDIYRMFGAELPQKCWNYVEWKNVDPGVRRVVTQMSGCGVARRQPIDDEGLVALAAKLGGKHRELYRGPAIRMAVFGYEKYAHRCEGARSGWRAE